MAGFKNPKVDMLQTMTEVRAAIDDVDQRIVPLLLERLSYIDAAARIKQDRDSVRDMDRVEDVVQKACKTANSTNGNSEYIAIIYRHLIEYSINHEYREFDKQRS